MEDKQKQKERLRKEKIDRQRAAQSGGRYKPPSADSTGAGTGIAMAAAPAGDTGGGDPDSTGGGGEGDTARLVTGAQSDGATAPAPKRRTWLQGAIGSSKKASSGSKADKNRRLSFAERVELQKRRDQEQREEKERREMMRLRKLKKQQDQREEERKARVKREQAEKDKYNNLEEYEAATSDPYIVFSIDPPTAPGCKVLRTGGYFGRTVRTDMMTNTLNPTFEEARKPLAYLGTRSELENELLRIRVYDWDFFSADDLIGQADVPLNGLLEYGQVEVELTLDQPDTSKSKVRGKYPKITKPAGKLFGQILFEGKTPDYQQLGLLIERKPGITYLAVRLNRATKLIPADPNGTSDPFVVVDWDGAQQTSKVTCPIPFPLRLASPSPRPRLAHLGAAPLSSPLGHHHLGCTRLR